MLQFEGMVGHYTCLSTIRENTAKLGFIYLLTNSMVSVDMLSESKRLRSF